MARLAYFKAGWTSFHECDAPPTTTVGRTQSEHEGGPSPGVTIATTQAYGFLLTRCLLEEQRAANALVGLNRKSLILLGNVGGAERNRTAGLCSAIAALSHLSYSPNVAR